MYRLPQCDRNGGLLERAAFLALNAGALLLVGIVLLDGARFSAGREEITRALSTEVKSLSPEPSGVAQQPPPIALKPAQQTAGAPKLHDPKS
ncbi:MAG TPA: hypothetical protein VFE51_25125 [Verrucomicrobiae bacterium]|nr:hypothetical protein [Verrucomicrobiae bacterium]